MRRLRWVLTAWVLGAVATRGAVFQYTVPVETGKSGSTAFLWVPAEARALRGAVMAGMTLMEREFVKDPLIRAACADQRLAIVFLKCGLGGADLQKVLDDLAKASGYRELSVAPLLFVGHSAGGPQARDCAVKMSARCFGLVQYRGGGPWGAPPVAPGIPTLLPTLQAPPARWCCRASRNGARSAEAAAPTERGNTRPAGCAPTGPRNPGRCPG